MALTPYPSQIRLCDGSGLNTVRTSNGPEAVACFGCAACTPALRTPRASLRARIAATGDVFLGAAALDDAPM